jgi:hypothetical protein
MPSSVPPSFESLRCFVEAARLLNFRAAARAVALTPAALGQRIAQLEAQIGQTLFHRTTRRVTLSEAGLAPPPTPACAPGAARPDRRRRTWCWGRATSWGCPGSFRCCRCCGGATRS